MPQRPHLTRWRDRIALAVLAGSLSAAVVALEVAGVTLPDRAEVAGQTLALNGAGIRSKFFVRIYVGSLYLREPTQDAAAALSMAGPKRMRLDIIRSSLSVEQVTNAWRDGFNANLSRAELAALDTRINDFNALWPGLKRGDRVELDFSDGDGTVVKLNDRQLGAVPGKDFNDAMLRIWIGEVPADGGLKRAMLRQ